MDQAGAKTPTFLWRGILILLPVVLLAAVGLYSLRQDRQMAQVEAEARCQEAAGDCAAKLSDGLFKTMKQLDDLSGLESPMEIDDEGRAVALRGHGEIAASADLPVFDPLAETNLSEAQLHAWQKARRLEFSGGPATNEILAWREFIKLCPEMGTLPAPSPAFFRPNLFLMPAMYNLGVALWNNHEMDEACQWFFKVNMERSATTESGVPLWLLAEEKLAASGHVRANQSYMDAVNHPGFLTPILLSDLKNHHHDTNVWEAQWRNDEDTRDFYAHVQPMLRQNPPQPAFWTWWKGESWLVVLSPADRKHTFTPGQTNYWVDRFSERVVLQALDQITSGQPPQPVYAKMGIEIAGKNIRGYEGAGMVLASAFVPLMAGEKRCVIVFETLPHPQVLYARQHRRTLWFAAIILASAAAASAGFVSAYRGFHQQLRLSEMKSNFVSSVSHELRAPIASMRLLAESLERGKITETVKQKEYYRFLVQESQRLSSLIENILDFSRIEQGRKQYHFESTNLPSLVEQTVKIMQPCAMERGVELIIEEGQWGDFLPVQCDGLSIQQALINLIDNAIKHSPTGAIVRVGMARRAAETSIFVEDNGPGIPADEHQRIFERFYRRGSELRRETQGIGIGLSIVKHTMDAHGGRVEVRSEVGRGSRFTLVLPDAQEQSK
jgi:signal transduction histidine kinase